MLLVMKALVTRQFWLFFLHFFFRENKSWHFMWIICLAFFRPIHKLDHPKCWPIHILPFDFLYQFIAGSRRILRSIHWIPREQAASKNLWAKKYTHIPGYQKSRAFHIRIKKNCVSHILFVANHIPGSAEKGGLMMMIQHALPYYAIYRNLPPLPPPPPPPHPHPQSVLLRSCRASQLTYPYFSWTCLVI